MRGARGVSYPLDCSWRRSLVDRRRTVVVVVTPTGRSQKLVKVSDVVIGAGGELVENGFGASF